MKDGYPDAKSLPPADAGPARFGTDVWLKLTNTPPGWGDKLLQVSVFAWDDGKKAWEPDPIATSDRVVWGKGRLWQHNLTLLAPKGSARASAWAGGTPALPRGRYLVKVHLGKDDAGQAEVTSAWPEGYGRMTALDAARVAK